MSFALRGLARSGAAQLSQLPRQTPALFQQRRGMAGDDEPDHLFVNWWDNPYNPDLWHKHQLAWWGVAFWGAIFYVTLGRGGKKKEDKAAAAEPAAAKAH